MKANLALNRAMEYMDMNNTIKVRCTLYIGYSLLFRLASGEMFGNKQRLQIHIYDIESSINIAKGVAMELKDCAFDDIDFALMIGSIPRKDGMERRDLLDINGKIFNKVGNILNQLHTLTKYNQYYHLMTMYYYYYLSDVINTPVMLTKLNFLYNS